ncbi:hypothetical protein ABIA39_001091 [Nocardia sp. GAS34]|uniref:hypothetical protein n=1 Tax=unclassified Nocardia TaxID=2637762 RepID=UPI003D25C4D4
MAQTSPAGTSPVDLNAVQNSLNTLSQDASNGKLKWVQLDSAGKVPTDAKSVQFDETAASLAVSACNTLAQYLSAIANAVGNLRLEPGAVTGLPDGTAVSDPVYSSPGVQSTANLIAQFNTAHDNITRVIDVHQNTILRNIVSTFEYSCGLLKATDANSASKVGSVSAFEQNMSNLNAKLSDMVNQVGGASSDPWHSLTLGDMSPIKVPTDPGKFQSWTSAKWGDATAWSDFAETSDSSVTGWSSLPEFDNLAAVQAKLQDGKSKYFNGPETMWAKPAGTPRYSGQLTTQALTAAPTNSMQWSDLHQLSKLNAQLVADKAQVWTYLAGRLKEGFDRFTKAMGQATTTAGWYGTGADAAAKAMSDYSATGPELIGSMSYMGWLLQNTADWLATTREYMPTVPTPPSESIIPAKVHRDWTTFSSGKASLPTKHSGQVKTNVSVPDNKIEVIYQGGVAGPDHPLVVDKTLTDYYQRMYTELYYNSYGPVSKNVPVISVPAPVTNAPGDPGTPPGDPSGPGGPSSPGVPSSPGGPAGGGGVVSVSTGGGIPRTTMASIPSAGSGLGAPNGGDVPAIDFANAVHTHSGAGAAPGSLSDGSSGVGATTPAAYTPSSDPTSTLASGAQQIAGAAQQALSTAGQGLSQSQQQQFADAAAATAAMNEARSGVVSSGPGGSGGAAAAEDIAGETSALESKTGMTAAAKLFPRASGLAASQEELLGRGAVPAEAEGGGGYPGGGMGSPGAAAKGNDKGHRTPGYLNSRRHLDKAMGDAPLTSISVVDEK